MLKRFALAIYRASNAYILGLLERVIVNSRSLDHKNRAKLPPPIFIIGAPRSGSTFLLQLIINNFDVAYITNRHAKLFGSIALAELIHKKNFISENQTVAMKSDLGRTEGALGPSEAAAWWYQFVPYTPHYVQDVNDRAAANFRRSIINFTAVSRKIPIFKNNHASLRLRLIDKAFPDAIYIYIVRDLKANAISLLNARKKAHGCYDKWWSCEPGDIHDLKSKSPAEQVLEQVKRMNEIIENDLSELNISSDRILYVNYESICNETEEFLVRFRDTCIKNGFPAKQKTVDNKRINSRPYKSNTLPKTIIEELDDLLNDQRYR